MRYRTKKKNEELQVKKTDKSYPGISHRIKTNSSYLNSLRPEVEQSLSDSIAHLQRWLENKELNNKLVQELKSNYVIEKKTKI